MSKTTTAVWSLSGFGDEIDPDPAVQAAVLLALGASHIEVRSAWGTNVSELALRQVAALKEILDEKGLKVSAVASPIGKVDESLPVAHELDRLSQVISVAKGLGTNYIRIFSFFRSEDRSAADIRNDVMARVGTRRGWAVYRDRWPSASQPAPSLPSQQKTGSSSLYGGDAQ